MIINNNNIDIDDDDCSIFCFRVMSHRCLVVIGNLKGTAGYGMGKGSLPKIALQEAFRFQLITLIGKNFKYISFES